MKSAVFWILPSCVALAFLPLPLSAAIGVAGFAGLLLFWRREWLASLWREIKPFWPVLVVLSAFFYFPFSSVDPAVRTSGKYFTIYMRFVAGLSIWEILLIFSFSVLTWRKWRTGILNISFGDWRGAPLYLFFMALGIAFGLLHVKDSLLAYGPTELKGIIVATMPIAYFLAVFLLMVNFLSTLEHVEEMTKWLDRLTLGLIIYGTARFVLILSGYVQTMIPFGIPIVLYDQLSLLYAPIFIITARLVMKERLGAMQYVSLALMLFFIVCSTRRFNYIFLVLGVGVVLVIGIMVKCWNWKRSLGLVFKTLVTLALFFSALMITVPSFVDGVLDSANSINMYSKFGQKHGGDSRVAQIDNIFANFERRPYAYLVGFGLGTKWHAILPQPMNSMAYMQEYTRQSKGWYPKFHLPYIATFYRFGILGTTFLLMWLGYYLKTHLRILRVGDQRSRSFLIGTTAFLVISLPIIGDSPSPVYPVICAIYMGLLERFAALDKQLARAAEHHESQHHTS